MKRAVFASVIGAGLVMLAIFLSGCAGKRINLVDSGLLSLEKQASGKVYSRFLNEIRNGLNCSPLEAGTKVNLLASY